MKKFFNKIISSLDTYTKDSFSGRKLTALFSILMGAYITYCKLPTETYLHALYAWQMLCVLCLGIVTAEQIIKLKNGKEDKDVPA